MVDCARTKFYQEDFDLCTVPACVLWFNTCTRYARKNVGGTSFVRGACLPLITPPGTVSSDSPHRITRTESLSSCQLGGDSKGKRNLGML